MTLVTGNLRYLDIRGKVSSSDSRPVGLSTTAIFSVFSGYFFGNFRDKASNIIYHLCSEYLFIILSVSLCVCLFVQLSNYLCV